jgi:hypothetical protein
MAVATHHASCLANERLSRNAKGQVVLQLKSRIATAAPMCFEKLIRRPNDCR